MNVQGARFLNLKAWNNPGWVDIPLKSINYKSYRLKKGNVYPSLNPENVCISHNANT